MKLFPKPSAPPAVEPVTLAELRAQLRTDATDEDALLFGYLIAAREMVERDIGESLGSRTLIATAESWPSDYITLGATVTAVQSITYTNAAGSVVAWTDYVFRSRLGAQTIIRPKAGTDWPTLGDDPVITITVTGGLNPVPELARSAILLLAAHWANNREAASSVVTSEIALGYDRIVNLLGGPSVG